jgi:hypothetical protein
MIPVEYKFKVFFGNSGPYTVQTFKLFIGLEPTVMQSECSRGRDYEEEQPTVVNCSTFKKGYRIFNAVELHMVKY